MKTELEFLGDIIARYPIDVPIYADQLVGAIREAKYLYEDQINNNINSSDRFEDNKPV